MSLDYACGKAPIGFNRRKPGIEGWSCATSPTWQVISCGRCWWLVRRDLRHCWVGTEIPVQITTFALLTAPCANKSRWFVFFYFRLQLRSLKSRFSVLRQQNSIWRRGDNREIASIDVFVSVAQWITSFAAVLRLGSSLKTAAKKAINRTKCKEFVSYPELRDTVGETTGGTRFRRPIPDECSRFHCFGYDGTGPLFGVFPSRFLSELVRRTIVNPHLHQQVFLDKFYLTGFPWQSKWKNMTSWLVKENLLL